MSKSNVITNIYDGVFSLAVVGAGIVDIPKCKLVKVVDISLFVCEITLVIRLEQALSESKISFMKIIKAMFITKYMMKNSKILMIT